jgi:hypothetical protein
MALRAPNNPNTDVIILNVLRNVMHLNLAGQPCTYLASIDPGGSDPAGTGLNLTYVQNKYKMALGISAAVPYAVHLSSGKQEYSKEGAGLRTYIGQFVAICEYCGRWDNQPDSIDAIRSTIAADLERIKANIESNDSNEPEKLVPARYVGTNKIQRSKMQGPGIDGNGNRRSTLAIEYGDVLMMPEREILGQTYLFDPQGNNPPQDLGAGRRVKPEHVGKSDEELAALGYEFHAGRSDFQLVVPETPGESQPEQPKAKRRATADGGV